MKAEKDGLRRSAREDRKQLVIDHAAHCRGVRAFLAANVRPDLVVVVFDAIPGEVDLSLLTEDPAESPDRFGLVRTPLQGRRLTVHRFGGPLEQHRYGFEQPTAESEQVPDRRIGAVLVPGLAFDARGGRLGRGGGYYDELLTRLDRAVPTVGMTADYLVESVPMEQHDMSVTHLASSTGVTPVDGS